MTDPTTPTGKRLSVKGRAQSWCFRCDSDHAWTEPCPPVIRLSRTTCPTCAGLGCGECCGTGR